MPKGTYKRSPKEIDRLRLMSGNGKGKKKPIRTEEHKLNLSLSLKGRVSPNKGKKLSKEWKEKLSFAKIGNNNALGHKLSDVARRKISQKQLGTKKTWVSKRMKQLVGEKHPRWIKDRTQLKKEGDRRSSAYVTWRKEVWLRDNFKCKIANLDCNGKIEAHHISGYSKHPELRFIINNGITLCHAHHPRKRAEEKRLIQTFQKLVSMSVSKK